MHQHYSPTATETFSYFKGSAKVENKKSYKEMLIRKGTTVKLNIYLFTFTLSNLLYFTHRKTLL